MELDLSLKESSNNPLENPIVPPPGTLEKKESENQLRRNMPTTQTRHRRAALKARFSAVSTIHE